MKQRTKADWSQTAGTRGPARCRLCGCSDREPCLEGCSWVEGDLCSTCAVAIEALADYLRVAHRARPRKLIGEAYRLLRNMFDGCGGDRSCAES